MAKTEKGHGNGVMESGGRADVFPLTSVLTAEIHVGCKKQNQTKRLNTNKDKHKKINSSKIYDR